MLLLLFIVDYIKESRVLLLNQASDQNLFFQDTFVWAAEVSFNPCANVSLMLTLGFLSSHVCNYYFSAGCALYCLHQRSCSHLYEALRKQGLLAFLHGERKELMRLKRFTSLHKILQTPFPSLQVYELDD